MMDDAELICRYAEDRDEAAFAALVERHLPLVYSAAHRRLAGDSHAAADVAQQVFVALARQPLSPAQRHLLTGWLYTTTRNVAVDFIRSERRRRAREQESHAMNETAASSPSPDWQIIRPVLDDVMDELGSNEREAVLLRFFTQHSFPQIGSALGLTEDAARRRVERALEKLRARFARRGVTSTGAALGLMLTTHAALGAPAGAAGAITTAALHAATTTITPVTGILHFMSTSKIVAGAAGVFLVFGLVATYYETHQRKEFENSTRVLARELASLHAQVERSAREMEEAEKKLAAEQADTAKIKAVTLLANPTSIPGSADARSQAAAKSDPIAHGKEFIAAHPELTGLVTSYGKAVVSSRYHELMQRLQLTPQQIDRFTALTAELQGGVGWDTITQAPFAEVNVGDSSRAQIESRLRDLLGADGYAQYEGYTRTLISNVRSIAQQVIRSDYFTANPMSAEQANDLTNLVTQNSARFQSGGGVNLTPSEWQNVLAGASGLLSPPQLAALAAVRDKVQFQQAVNQAANQAINEAKISAGIPAGH